jgi:septal ring factor EnvC (AmiA/AmiB activator)
MDESLFFLDNETSAQINNSIPTLADHQLYKMVVSYTIGMFVGLFASMVYTFNTNTQKRIDRLYDEKESLENALENADDDNDKLREENDKLTVDASANERLITRLQEEICRLINKVDKLEHENAALDSDNNVYIAEISQLQNSLMRMRHANPLLRKRPRGEDDL